jgi:hypothetical protein
MKLDGSISAEGQAPPKLREGTSVVRVPGGVGFDFDGKLSGLMFPDNSSLSFDSQLTIAAWIRPRAYPVFSGSQVVFRGDDRDSLDPYTLVIHPDGTINFSVMDEQGHAVKVSAPIALNRWTHVVASLGSELYLLDRKAGKLTLWLDGRRVSVASGGTRPFLQLNPRAAPGLGVGNVQHDKGPHNQPFNGTLADLRIWDRVVSPEDLKINREGWNVPWRCGPPVRAVNGK